MLRSLFRVAATASVLTATLALAGLPGLAQPVPATIVAVLNSTQNRAWLEIDAGSVPHHNIGHFVAPGGALNYEDHHHMAYIIAVIAYIKKDGDSRPDPETVCTPLRRLIPIASGARYRFVVHYDGSHCAITGP